MTELYYCHHCEHSYEVDTHEIEEGDPDPEQCPKCQSLDTTTDPDQMPKSDNETYREENKE